MVDRAENRSAAFCFDIIDGLLSGARNIDKAVAMETMIVKHGTQERVTFCFFGEKPVNGDAFSLIAIDAQRLSARNTGVERVIRRILNNLPDDLGLFPCLCFMDA